MVEKNPTMAELIKVIECCSSGTGCSVCIARNTPLCDEWVDKVANLIRHQQKEIERLTKRENELVEDKAHWINEWKEQVEYTAELQQQVKDLQQELSAAYENRVTICKQLAEQKAEIERLTERVFDCTAVIEYNEKCSKEIQAATILLEQRNNEIAELQKQVDELTDKLGKVLLGIKADEVLIAKGVEKAVEEQIEYMCLDCPYKLKFIEIEKQAVKDTAKEIYLWLEETDKRGMTVPFSMVLRQLKERYGVEVE